MNGDTSAPDANNQGIFETIKWYSGASYRKFVVQKYYPAKNGTEALKIYTRTGVVATDTWTSWVTFTGV